MQLNKTVMQAPSGAAAPAIRAAATPAIRAAATPAIRSGRG